MRLSYKGYDLELSDKDTHEEDNYCDCARYSESPNGNIYEMCNSCVGSLWFNLIVQETFVHSD